MKTKKITKVSEISGVGTYKCPDGRTLVIDLDIDDKFCVAVAGRFESLLQADA